MLHRTPTGPTGHRTLTFTLPLEWAGRVSVVGNFNDWTPGHLVLVEEGGEATGSVALPADYVAVFRYLGEGGHWFDEPAADFVDAGGSVVLQATDAAPVIAPEPEPTPDTPATKAERVAAKRRKEAEKAIRKAARKQARAGSKLADRAKKAEEKQRKAADKLAREREKAARKLAKRAGRGA